MQQAGRTLAVSALLLLLLLLVSSTLAAALLLLLLLLVHLSVTADQCTPAAGLPHQDITSIPSSSTSSSSSSSGILILLRLPRTTACLRQLPHS
jgi:hypothetical protein